MQILRIEHKKTKVGPYNGQYRFRFNHSTIKHPTGDEDGLKSTSKHLYGFKSLTQLHRWFTLPELTRMHKEEYKLVIYKVLKLHTQASNRQIIFKKGKATKIATLDII